jgi:hypothetical protein
VKEKFHRGDAKATAIRAHIAKGTHDFKATPYRAYSFIPENLQTDILK